ncbi:MAG: VCBS repeat-containing protein [Anaerolineales bacterium]|nr:VCBS repeat-containing protein [Anaerolineales bacterium]
MKMLRVFSSLSIGLVILLCAGFIISQAAPGNPALSPPMNSHNNPSTTQVSIEYDELIDAGTVNENTFAIYAMQTGLKNGTRGVDGSTIIMTPTNPFYPGEMVQASATKATLSITAEQPISPTVWQFRIATEGGTGLYEHSDYFGNGWTNAIDLGDMDGDGDLDTVLVKQGDSGQVWANDGNGNYGTSPLDTFGGSNMAFDLGDVDGDGDLDVVACWYELEPAQVWKNNGAGNLGVAAYDTFGYFRCTSVNLGDVDGDGDLDALFVNSYLSIQVWLNDGTGAFGDAAFWSIPRNYSCPAGELGDIDGDGDLDILFVAYQNHQGEIWLNNGSGNFGEAAHDLFGDGYCTDMVAGDLDGDHDLDVVLSKRSPVYRQEVWMNDGSGDLGETAFDVFSTTYALNTEERIALGDLDADGDLDLLVNNQTNPREVWLNDGGGAFGPDVYTTFGPNESDWEVALGDIDNDGDLDAVFGTLESGATYYNSAWINLNDPDLTISKSVRPEVVRVGEWVTFTLEFSNLGVEPATDVLIYDLIPYQFTNTHVISAGVAITQINTTYEWRAQDLLPGQGGVITITSQVQWDVVGTEEIDNTAYIDYKEDDSNYTNNSSTATVIKVDYSIYLPLVVRQP